MRRSDRGLSAAASFGAPATRGEAPVKVKLSTVMEDLRLDVRAMPRPERHPKIFALFDALAPGQALVLTSDHEPRPLRAEFDHKRPEAHQWDQKHLGDGRWEVRITRIEGDVAASPVSKILSRTPIFAHVDQAALDTLAYHARRVAVKRNHIVAEQAVNWPYLGVVDRGVVQATLTTPIGREQTLYEILPTEVFGEIALLDGGSMPLRFVAVTSDTVVLLLSAPSVRWVLDRSPEVARGLGMAAAQHARIILDHVSANLSQSTTARVALALLPYAGPDEGLTDALDPLPSLTQNEIATRAGTVKEVVSRAVAELEQAGALERKGGHIVRLDRRRLTQWADEAH